MGCASGGVIRHTAYLPATLGSQPRAAADKARQRTVDPVRTLRCERGHWGGVTGLGFAARQKPSDGKGGECIRSRGAHVADSVAVHAGTEQQPPV